MHLPTIWSLYFCLAAADRKVTSGNGKIGHRSKLSGLCYYRGRYVVFFFTFLTLPLCAPRISLLSEIGQKNFRNSTAKRLAWITWHGSTHPRNEDQDTCTFPWFQTSSAPLFSMMGSQTLIKVSFPRSA